MAALKVDDAEKDSLIFSIGGKLNMNMLTAHLELGYETLDNTTDLNSSFVGTTPSFKTDGIDQGRTIVTTGIGLNFMQDQPLNMSVNYDATIRDDYNDQGISATLRYKW